MGTTTKTSLKAAVKRKKAIETEHFVPVDEAQAAALAAAEQRLQLARFAGQDVEKAEADLEAVQAEARKTGVSFVIRGIGRVAFEELVREHPPTEDQVTENEASFNPNTFWPALCAASVVGGMTPEEWKTEVFDSPEWGPGELKDLRDKVMKVNTSSRVAQLGN